MISRCLYTFTMTALSRPVLAIFCSLIPLEITEIPQTKFSSLAPTFLSVLHLPVRMEAL